MRLVLAVLAIVAAVAAPTFASTAHPDDNEVMGRYREAHDLAWSIWHPNGGPAVDTEEAAVAFERLGAEEAHEQSTVTGLPGQKDGKPNHAPAEAWCYVNAGTIRWKIGDCDAAVSDYQKALACPGISSDAKEIADRMLAKKSECARRVDEGPEPEKATPKRKSKRK